MYKTLYAILTNNCNLRCPHCFIKDDPNEFNREVFLEKLHQFEGNVILFGGEPTLYEDRLYDVFESFTKNGKGKISGISTNLVKMNDDILNLFKSVSGIATSWNLSRFNEDQYATWLKNCSTVGSSGVSITINITLTKDLIEHDQDLFLDMIDSWDHTSVRNIRFEQLVSSDNNDEHFENVDNWLCSLYTKWRSPINCITFQSSEWYFNCKGMYTLYPDGKMRVGCPNSAYVDRGINLGCLSCDRSEHCLPCNLQRNCSRPHKLLKLICGN